MFVELAYGMASNRGYVEHVSKLPDIIKKKGDEPIFRSIYMFDSKIQEHMDTGRKSSKGYIGKYYIPQLVFDIDKGKDTDDFVLHRTKLFIEELAEDWKLEGDQISVFYSGTGYHILTKDFFGFTPSNELPEIVKETMQRYFPQIDTSFYQPSGLIRLNNTKNIKSNLYKVQLLQEEITTVEEIKVLASKPRNLYVKLENPDRLYLESIVRPQKNVKPQIGSQNSSRVVTCVQNIYNKGEESGTRHDRIMAMSSVFRRAGIPMLATIASMKEYAGTMQPYEVEKNVEYVYKQQYEYGCSHPVLAEFCDPKCMFYQNKDYLADVLNAKDMEKEYMTHVRTDFQDTAFNLQKYLPIKQQFLFYPGYFAMLIGASGTNKTAWVQNLLVKLKDYAPVLYLNTEFSNNLLYRRFIQIAHDMDKHQVFDHYTENTNSLSDAVTHINYMHVVPNIKELDRLIARWRPKIVVIDTITDMDVPGQSGLQKEEVLAREIKQMAERHNTIIMGVHHISKAASEDEKGNKKDLTMLSGKGSSSFPQKADVVLGIESIGKLDRKISVLKARDDEPFTLYANLNQDTFRILHQGENPKTMFPHTKTE